jgi:hypothetical protein
VTHNPQYSSLLLFRFRSAASNNQRSNDFEYVDDNELSEDAIAMLIAQMESAEQGGSPLSPDSETDPGLRMLLMQQMQAVDQIAQRPVTAGERSAGASGGAGASASAEGGTVATAAGRRANTGRSSGRSNYSETQGSESGDELTASMWASTGGSPRGTTRSSSLSSATAQMSAEEREGRNRRQASNGTDRMRRRALDVSYSVLYHQHCDQSFDFLSVESNI